MGIYNLVIKCLGLLGVTAIFVLSNIAGATEPFAPNKGAPQEADPPEIQTIGADEKLGLMSELDLAFLDEQGNKVKLADLVDRPTLILPVYYHCPTACQIMLGNLSEVINKVPLDLGDDYRIIAVSFDHDETPEDAKKSKTNYGKLIKKDFLDEHYLYLTGPKKEIQIFFESIGYRFIYMGKHSYSHPNIMIVLAPGGKIIRYLYGPAFLAFDIGMALTEAAKGTPSLTIRKLMTYCFTYDPKSKTYTFTAVRYIVFTILIALGLAMFFLLRKKRKTTERPPERL